MPEDETIYRIIFYLEKNLSISKIAREVNKHYTAVYYFVKKYKTSGEL